MRLWGETVARLRANLSADQLREARRLNDAWQETRLALNATLQGLGEIIAPVITDIIRHFGVFLQGIRQTISAMREVWLSITGGFSDNANRRFAGVTGGALVSAGGRAGDRLSREAAARNLTAGQSIRGPIRGAQLARGIGTIGRFAGYGAFLIPIVTDIIVRTLGLRDELVQSRLDEVNREIARAGNVGVSARTGRQVADRQLETDRQNEIEEFEGERSVLRARANQRLADLQSSFDRTELRSIEDYERNKSRIIRNFSQAEERRAEENRERRLELLRRYDFT